MKLTDICPDTPRAPHFIVTIYGDVVEPRGGTLWMGTLIETCARHGISESLVRTAVSRLVSAGRLEGVRVGRRSYYRLSERAKAEFRQASRILFDPPAAPKGWRVALLGAGAEDLQAPWVRLGSGAALAPARDDLSLKGGVILHADQSQGDFPTLAAQLWPLSEVAGSYRAVLSRYSALDDAACAGPDALALRLRLVDDYRRAALTDPRLPFDALPSDWPAPRARALFVRLYHALSSAADQQVAVHFETQDGPLLRETDATQRRLASLA
ncbi:PaaX family transcriptional regulator C-terminal domain-containing protein [Sagittula sp. S175]|uniref:PaaX family transcriptional regulator C-terminal domain-containing protein n=1 Tax=Sagittula sp. S175 TaxID=3415129 RepID=UPI003C798B15